MMIRIEDQRAFDKWEEMRVAAHSGFSWVDTTREWNGWPRIAQLLSGRNVKIKVSTCEDHPKFWNAAEGYAVEVAMKAYAEGHAQSRSRWSSDYICYSMKAYAGENRTGNGVSNHEMPSVCPFMDTLRPTIRDHEKQFDRSSKRTKGNKQASSFRVIL
jgi:hypothetical protein